MDRGIEIYYQQYQLEQFVRIDHMRQFTLHRYRKGEPICELEQPIEYLHFFVEGRAKVLLPAENGRQLLLCYYEPLQLFGDLELFEPKPLATTTIEALTTSACLSLDREFVVNQIAMEPLFLRQLCLSLGRKLGRVVRNSAFNLLHPLEQRIASYILATASLDDDHQLVFTGNVTHTAELLGTSFRHLHRTLQSLCEQEILVKRAASYTVREIGELERRAAGVYVVT